jgi:peptidoglycan/xylan/chitin deacetylase (PgdA/CDA1 family)
MSRLRGWLRSFIGNRTAPVILIYHRIAAVDFDPWSLAVDPEAFALQLAKLSSLRRVLPLAEFVERHRDGTLPANAAAITFDDGCVCNAVAAAPILSRFGLPATFFLTTGMIGSPDEFWWDALERIVFDPAAGEGASVRLGSQEIRIELGKDPEGVEQKRVWRALAAPPATPRQQSYELVWSALKHQPADVQRKVLKDLAAQVGSRIGPRSTHIPMTVEQAVALSETPGFDIGGHTIDHVSLPGLDAAPQVRQIRDSRLTCEDWAGRPCTNFAYPYGDVSPLTLASAAEAGVTGAVTTRHAAVGALDPILALPRIAVTRSDVLEHLQSV